MTDTIHSGAFSPNGVPIAVFGWLADLTACGHYRVIQPLKALARKHNVQVEAGSGSGLPYTVLVAQRTHKLDTVEFLQHVKASRQAINGVSVPKIVYEIDDDLWSIEKDNPGYEYYTENNVLDNALTAIELADAVTVSTEPLADLIREHNDNVYVLPNSIDRKYLNELRYPYQLGAQDKPFVMGWAGSATHERDFRECAGAINSYMKLHENTRMVFFGTNYSNLLDASVRDRCRVARWTKTVDDYLELLSMAQIDVMLAPLSPSVFNESKSNLRILEANALGIPVIATNWGPYENTEDSSPGVHYVKPGDSWISALHVMHTSPWHRLSMSQTGRSWVETNYAQDTTVDKWLEAYENVLV